MLYRCGAGLFVIPYVDSFSRGFLVNHASMDQGVILFSFVFIRGRRKRERKGLGLDDLLTPFNVLPCLKERN